MAAAEAGHGRGEMTPRAIERAVSLIRKAEVKSVPRHKIKGFLERKDLNEAQINRAFQRYYNLENLVEINVPSRPLGFSVVMDSSGNNCVVSSIQHTHLEQQGLEPFSRIVKVNDKYVEHKDHQDVIDVILDQGCPMKLTFRKRKHKKRGSLFEKVLRPTKSLPAIRSSGQRGSMVVGQGNSTGTRGSTVNPQLMMQAASKSRGSTTDVIGGADVPDDDDEESQEKRQPSSGRMQSRQRKSENHGNLLRGDQIHNWEEEELDAEAAEMKKMMVAMMAQTTQKKGLQRSETDRDEHMKDLSRNAKSFMHAMSEQALPVDDGNDYIQDLLNVWNEFDDDEISEMSEAQDEEQSRFNTKIRQEAAELRQNAKDESRVNFEAMEPLTFDDGTKVPTRARMNSAPVYSTDAMSEMVKGTALLKYGKRGAPKFRHFQLSEDKECMIWFSNKKDLKKSRIIIGDMTDVLTNVKHERKANEELVNTSFAIIYGDGQYLRLTAKNETEAHIWIEGLKVLIKKAHKNIPLNTIHHIPLQKQPGLDMHRRGSLAQLLDARTGQNSMYRQKNVDKIRVELQNIRVVYGEIMDIINSEKFENSMSTEKRMVEKERIIDRMSELQSRLNSVENQAEASLDTPVFDIDAIKTDVWNVSVDLLSFQCKLKVLCSTTTEL